MSIHCIIPTPGLRTNVCLAWCPLSRTVPPCVCRPVVCSVGCRPVVCSVVCLSVFFAACCPVRSTVRTYMSTCCTLRLSIWPQACTHSHHAPYAGSGFTTHGRVPCEHLTLLCAMPFCTSSPRFCARLRGSCLPSPVPCTTPLPPRCLSRRRRVVRCSGLSGSLRFGSPSASFAP